MDADRFDALARTLNGAASSRRTAVAGLAALGLAAGHVPARATRRRRKVRRNAFGCVNVGRFCRSADQCCSGICRGNKGKRKCRAHDTGGCALADNFCAGGNGNDCAPGCVCNVTTGKAPHCGPTVFCPAAECQRDADCGEPGAACIPPVNCQGCGTPATQNFCQRPCVV